MGLSESIKKLRKLIEIENNRTYTELMQLMVILNTVKSECEVLEQLREYGSSLLKYVGSGFISYLTDYYDDAILREYGFIVNPRDEVPVEPEDVDDEPIYLMLDEKAPRQKFHLPDARPVIYIYSFCQQVEIICGRVTALGETMVLARGNSVVIGMGGSMIYGREEATVSLKEYARGEMADHSRCILTDQAFCTARDYVSVTASHFSRVRLYGNHVSASLRHASLFFAAGSPAYLSLQDSAMGMALNARCVEIVGPNVHDPLPFITQMEVRKFMELVMPANPKLMTSYIEGESEDAFKERKECCIKLMKAIPTPEAYDLRCDIMSAENDWELEGLVLSKMDELYEWDADFKYLRMAFEEKSLESYRIFTNDLKGVPKIDGAQPYYVLGNVVADISGTEAKGYFAQNARGIIDDANADAKDKAVLFGKHKAEIEVSQSAWGIALDESHCTAGNGKPMATGMDQSEISLNEQSVGVAYQKAYAFASSEATLIHMSEEEATVIGRVEVLASNPDLISAIPTASVKTLPPTYLYKNLEGEADKLPPRRHPGR